MATLLRGKVAQREDGMTFAAGRDAAVVFENVQKTYDGRHLVVKDLNLAVRPGEFLTLLGPSGSGKSTCLMMLAGFEAPTSGRILLDGRELHNLPPHKRGIGVVFQNYALFPHMTVAENVAFPLAVRKVPRAARTERVRQALAMVRLERFADRRPAQLSGGQQQRVALARALVFAPRLVLLDEPLGALDKKLREQMQIEIKHLHEDLGVTMIFVTHDQDEALTMSDRVAVFEDGAIQQIDTPAALYERPANSFVATFLGDTNLLHGEVAAIEGELCRVRLDGGEIVQALRVHPAPPGGRVSLAVRPERVTLATTPSAGTVAARVVETIYHGAYVRIVLDAFGTRDFRALVRAGNPVAAVEPGTQVHASFAPRDCRALDPRTT